MSSQSPLSSDPLNMSNPSTQSSRPNTPATNQQPAAPLNVPSVDSEDIEHEWLDKTHHVFQSFNSDPYQLCKEFSVVRADYIKHRYGKTIKASTNNDGSLK